MGKTTQVETPPDLTSAEFDALLDRLYPLASLMMAQGRARPLMALDVAARLWTLNYPEDEDTAILRAHIVYLERKGYFAFTDWR